MQTIANWTPQQLADFIRQTVNEKAKPSALVKNFHSTADICALIENKLPELRRQFGEDVFQPAAFRHALKLLTTLKPGDLEPMADCAPRWDGRVLEAMASSAHVKRVRYGWYQLTTEDSGLSQTSFL